MTHQDIKFYKTMTSRKRGTGAYLRKNILSTDEEGLYPSKDFTKKRFNTNDTADGAFFNLNGYVIVEEGLNTAVYYDSGANDLSFLGNLPSSSDPQAVSKTDIGNKIIVLLANGELYSIQNTTFTLEYDFAKSASDSYIVYNGFAYYFSLDTEIQKLLPDFTAASPVVVKTTTATSQSEIINMQIFNEYIVMVRRLGNGVQFDFWSTTEADLDLYQKRVIDENCRHLGFGTVDGTLIFVKVIGNTNNPKEKQGDIEVSGFDGEKFVKLNSIRAMSEDVLVQELQAQSIGNGIMLIAIAGNTGTQELARNWVLKVENNGSIEVLFEPSDFTNGNDVKAVNVEYSYISMQLETDNGDIYYLHTRDSRDDYATYPNYTTSEYITNFMNNSRNVHKLTDFGVSFEKVFEQMPTGETLYIDYRVSERDDWTLLHEINTEKIKDYTADKYNESLREDEYSDDNIGQTIQSYVITKLPDNTELPRFNEIQFRFRLENGFSILQSWYNYEEIIRNTR